MVWRYIKEISHIWSAWIFAISGALGIYTQITNKNILFYPWVYWLVAAACFTIANIFLFSRLQKKINGYEAVEANLKISLISTGSYTPSSVIRSQKDHKDGLDDNGMPYESKVDAKVEIENLGIEEGVLDWCIDMKKSVLPEIFALIKGNENGNFLSHTTMEIPGRTRVNYSWELALAITTDDPVKLASVLSKNPGFTIYLSYRTRRIGGFSKPTIFVIKGDFSEYREQLIDKWEKWGFTNLLGILKQGITEEKP